MVANGRIGEPRFVTGSYHQDWLLLDTDWNWRLEPDKGGTLRAVGDIGSHWIDLTNFIRGQKVQSVMADPHADIPAAVREAAGDMQKAVDDFWEIHDRETYKMQGDSRQ